MDIQVYTSNTQQQEFLKWLQQCPCEIISVQKFPYSKQIEIKVTYADKK